MSKNNSPTETCCASGCRRCDVWREYGQALADTDAAVLLLEKAQDRRYSAEAEIRALARGFAGLCPVNEG